LHSDALGQTIGGTILDYDSKETVPYVTITNKRTKQAVQSNAQGIYHLNATWGDTIFLSHPAYSFTTRIVSAISANEILYIERRKYALEEVEVLSDMAKYKKDSADKYIFYRKTLKDAHLRPQAGFSNGLAVDGLFSSLALKISGKGKKSKKFAQMLERDEQVKFANVRYNPGLVMKLTGLSEDEAINFISNNPMPYDYVRAASDVEIQMWIRDTYKTWKVQHTGK
jgi:hypothetical protein